jgi:hypothetical protein
MANKWDERKKAQEDEYFVKKEREQLAKLRAKHEAESKTAAQQTSHMKCPKCGEALKERSFQKITIDLHGLPRHLARCWRVGASRGKRKRRVAGKILAEKWLIRAKGITLSS